MNWEAQFSHPTRRFMLRASLCLVPLGCAALVVSGCGGETKPRSIEEINAERETLPGLFMTPSGHQVETRRNQGVFVDESTGELVWPVYECTNPDCPGRTEAGPHLFIWSDPRFYAADDGTLGTRNFETIQEWREAVEAEGGDRQPTCKKCLEIRDEASETPEEAQEYSEFPRLHVPPATAQRMKQLDAEHQERIEYINRRIGRE